MKYLSNYWQKASQTDLNLLSDYECTKFSVQTDRQTLKNPHNNPHFPHRKSPQKEMQKEFLQVSGGSSCDKRRKSFVC